MAMYLGVALPAEVGGSVAGGGGAEWHLLSVAREAVVAPVLPPWRELVDDSGTAYFYNQATKQSTRRHPLDAKFLALVKRRREQFLASSPPADASRRLWMRFEREGGGSYWYNFASGAEDEDEGADHSAEAVEPLPVALVPQYDPTELAGGPTDLDVLTFNSWWYDGGKKHSVTVAFNIADQTFSLRLDNDRDVTLHGLSSVTAKHGMPVQCWDLHVGAKLNILGKPTTLLQADGATVAWLEHHASRLAREKEALVAALRKYQTRALPPAVTFAKGARQPGGTSLRSLLDQIAKLRAAVAVYRPSLLRAD